jgi:hypothetical protein
MKSKDEVTLAESILVLGFVGLVGIGFIGAIFAISAAAIKYLIRG